MARARTEEVEETLQDGNCAFSAFALALCKPDVFAKIEGISRSRHSTPDKTWHRFIKLAAAAFNVAEDWRSVKLAMLAWRKQDKAEFQKKAARVLRTLSHDLALTSTIDEYSYYYRKTTNELEFAYLAYTPNDGATEDDIFCRHSFIKTKFDEFKLQGSSTDAIFIWWLSQGYELFLDAMNKNAEYAGDLELARLARYFEVSLLRLNGPPLYRNFGYFPNIKSSLFASIDITVKEQIMYALIDRGIVDNDSSEPARGNKFDLPSLSLIYSRLGKMKDYDLVATYINALTANLKGTAVPRAWPESCVSELLHRNVIGRAPKSEGLFFYKEAENALRAIDEVPQLAWVKSLCLSYYESHPELTLKHKLIQSEGRSVGHWDNVNVRAPSDLISPVNQGLFKANTLFEGTIAAKFMYQALTNQLK